MKNRMLGGILLVSCTTIGGGVLALPINTYFGGFLPSTAIFLLCWFFLTFAACAMLEITLFIPHETNLISMAGKTLGVPGRVVAWFAYLLLLYALISTYLTGGTAWLLKLLHDFTGISITKSAAIPILAIVVGLFIVGGTAVTDKLNRLLSLGLFAAYCALIYFGLPNVQTEQLLATNDLPALTPTIPLIITTFGFSIVVPTLTEYLQRDQKRLLKTILIGSLIPLAVYLLWEWITLGILSIDGPHGLPQLAQNQADGTLVASALAVVTKNPWITMSANLFSVCAILTSLLGVSLSLFHFLADGLQMKKTGISGFNLFCATFIPPTVVVLFFPAGFDKILSFGGIFVAILLGILPVSMVWAARYKHQFSYQFRVFGGKPLLVVANLFFVYVIIRQIVNIFG